jgi:hypothetical protein
MDYKRKVTYSHYFHIQSYKCIWALCSSGSLCLSSHVRPTQSATTSFTSLDSSYPPPEYPRYGLLQPQLPPHLPTHALLYSPPAIPVYSVPTMRHSQPARSLFPAFYVAAQSPAASAVTAVCNSNPAQATILTAQGRHEASTEFLHCCRLLVHHDTRRQLTNLASGQPLGHHAHLFPRQPALHFLCDVLGPLHQNPKGYQLSFYNYVESLLSNADIPVDPTYAQGFFTAERFQAIYSAESWAMSPATKHLASLSAKTFNVYSMLQCLPVFHSHHQLLPAWGIEVLQAKSIAKMVHLLFAMIDMKPDFATSTFDKSILGTRLSLWSQLPGLIPINSLWNAHTASATFYWFNSLRELLQIFHNWIKAQRFHLTQGFTTAGDSQGAVSILLVNLPSHIPGQPTHLMEAVTQYNTHFQQRWYTQAFTISDPLWKSAPPADHFVPSQLPPSVKASAAQAPASALAREPASKRIKLDKLGQTADFICTTALIVPVEPLPSQKAAITTILHRLPRPGRFFASRQEWYIIVHLFPKLFCSSP